MRQNGNIQLQDPSASPTFALSRPAPAPVPDADVPPSLRRNLFGSHLSRRPAAPLANASTDRIPDPFQAMTSSARPSQPDTSIYRPKSPHNHNGFSTNIHNVYDQRQPQSRSISPTKPQHQVSSTASIIALDPVTGKPQLPSMPRLPARMPDGSEEDDEDEAEEDFEGEDDLIDDQAMAWRRVNAFDRPNPSQHDLDLHSSSLVGGLPTQHTRLHELIDATTRAGDYRDYEKIESILSEMQSQQRQRARTAVVPESSSLFLETPTDAGVSARTRGKARTTTRPQTEQPYSLRDGHQRVGGVGATLDPADKDDLLSLIMTSLSRRVQEADENAWIFGDERTMASGVSVSGLSNLSLREDIGVDY